MPKKTKQVKQAPDDESLFNNLISVKQAADILGVDRTQIWYLIRARKIVSKKIGGTHIVYEPSVYAYRESKSTRGWPAGKSRKTAS